MLQIHAKQAEFLESRALFRAFVAGISSGKSYIGSVDMIRRSKRGRLYMVVAPTYDLLAASTFRSFAKVLSDMGEIEYTDVKRSPPPSMVLRNGAEVLFRSGDNPDMLRGPNLSGMWLDEASLMKEEVFLIGIGRLREDGEQGWLTATFTPKGKMHWTYRTFAAGQPDTHIVHARTWDNPFNPPRFHKIIASKYTSQQVRQELEGVFLEGGGNHYHPDTWPRYCDTGDAYRIGDGSGRWHHVRKDECSRLVTLDWAMGKPKKVGGRGAAVGFSQGGGGDGTDGALGGDCTAFVVADFWSDPERCPRGALFMLDCVNERIPLPQNAPRLAELCRRWRPVAVAGDDDNLSETMLLECARYRDIPTARSMRIGGRNKLARSQAAIIRAERGDVYLPECDRPWVEVLSDQLAAFTGADGEPDDVADCVSILGRLADEFAPGEDRDGDDYPDEPVGGYGGGDYGGGQERSGFGGELYGGAAGDYGGGVW